MPPGLNLSLRGLGVDLLPKLLMLFVMGTLAIQLRNRISHLLTEALLRLPISLRGIGVSLGPGLVIRLVIVAQDLVNNLLDYPLELFDGGRNDVAARLGSLGRILAGGRFLVSHERSIAGWTSTR